MHYQLICFFAFLIDVLAGIIVAAQELNYIWYLKNLGVPDEIWSDHTLYSLDNHPKDEKLSKYHKERFSLFSKEQLKACAMFVKYCAEDEDNTDEYFAKKKYERYWSQYE